MNDFRPGSAWETWRKAGEAYFAECEARMLAIVEQSMRYARSRGLPHPEQIAKAFREGYHSAALAKSSQ